tara:strand:+ start:7014 stop:7379 length:366 start_codon:yes stop_codon:yes gene_type:complete
MYNPCLNSLGLIFFIPLISNSIKGIISTFVIFNGCLCHGSQYIDYKYKEVLTNYDIVCNTIFGAFILYSEKENKLLIITVECISVLSFGLNRAFFKSSPIIHVFGVQLPLFIVLYNYSEEL